MRVTLTDLTIKTTQYDKNPYGLHKILWSLFPHEPEARRDFLYQATPSLDGKLHILMQSPKPPDMSRLQEINAQLTSCQEHEYNFTKGQMCQFALSANPTKTRDGKRFPILHQMGLQRWLAGKLAGAAQIDAVVTIIQPSFTFTKDNTTARVHQVLFTGFLRITDAAEFETVLRKGIGHAKFLGLGMLTIKKMGAGVNTSAMEFAPAQ